MAMGEKITDEHIEWQDRAKILSMRDHFEYIQRLSKQGDEFLENVRHMGSDKPTEESTILAAKYKTRDAIHRFLSSVLLEFSLRLIKDNLSKNKRKPKPILDPQIKKAIADEVKRQLSISQKNDTKRKKKSL